MEPSALIKSCIKTLLGSSVGDFDLFVAVIFFEQELRHADFIDGHGVRLLPLVQDVLGAVAKAADGERTDLRVQRKLLQVHRTVGPNGQTLESKRNGNFLVHFYSMAGKILCRKYFIFLPLAFYVASIFVSANRGLFVLTIKFSH